jgi:hypothetical protein
MGYELLAARSRRPNPFATDAAGLAFLDREQDLSRPDGAVEARAGERGLKRTRL